MRIPFIGAKWQRWIHRQINKEILSEPLPTSALNSEKRSEKVIATLTSYPARISYVWIAIKSLMLQSYRPDRIILWLAEEQFPEKVLPRELLELTTHGLEIIWMHDIFGHKKYYYPVINQKEDEIVITFDDDIIYDPLLVERLIATHKKYPHCLVCERGQAFDDHSQENPGRWKTISSTGVKVPSYSINPSPGGGCLIPYGSFFKDATNEEIIRELAYKNDDLWYMFMSAEQGTKIVKTRKWHRTFTVIEDSQQEQMSSENILENKNIEIMNSLKNAYPKAWKRICGEIA